jgi:UDP-hydrolysing UDP-N-acetyl-D-glucosamine 2-epimerase
MEKKKVLVVLMNRANYARFRSTMQAIKEHPELELLTVVGSGMLLERFGTAAKVVEEDGFTIDREVYMYVEGGTPQTMAQTVGLGIQLLAPILHELKPDVVCTIGDRFETLATAVTATYMNIRLAHTQGGELTGTIDESVRHAITKLAHLHFPATEMSRDRVIQMGENPEYVINTGCPAIDLAKNADLSVERLKKLDLGGTGNVDLTKPYVLVVQHPVTTEYGAGYEQMLETLEALKVINMPVLMQWPNPDAGTDDISKAIRIFREQGEPSFPIKFYKNVEPEDYAALLANASCLIGNSSSFIREGSYLGTPAVLIGSRQQQREVGKNVIYVAHDRGEIAETVLNQIKHGKYKSENIYGDGTAGKQIADAIAKINPPIQKTFHDLGK